MSTSKSGLAKLPVELWKTIFEYVVGKHDLANLCVVDRRCCDIVREKLYRCISINIGTGEKIDLLLAQMLTTTNPGVAFVRDVTICIDMPRGPLHASATQQIDIVLNALPQDTLTSFHWKTTPTLPRRLYKALWQRQREVKVLEICPTQPQDAWSAGDNIDLLAILTSIRFPNLQGLRAVVDNVESATLACAALKRGTISELEVDARLWEEEPAHEVDEENGHWNDDEIIHNVQDVLTQTIFEHLERAKPGCPAKHNLLTSLTLKDVDLTLSKHTWFTYLDISTLKKLRLEHCNGVDIFLSQLASGAANPALHSFALIHDLGDRPDRTIHALEEILRFPRNKINHLELCLRNATGLPGAALIRNHGRSLRTLLLDISGKPETDSRSPDQNTGWGEPVPSPKRKYLLYNSTSFESIVTSCSSLRELGVAFPEFGLEYKELRENEDLLQWSDNNYKLGRNKGYYEAKNLQLARLASDLFVRHRSFDPDTGGFVKTLQRCLLKVIAFGVCEHDSDASPHAAYFVQSEVDRLSKIRPYADGVTLAEMQHYGLATDILPYDVRDFDAESRKNNGTMSDTWGGGWGGGNDHGGWGGWDGV